MPKSPRLFYLAIVDEGSVGGFGEKIQGKLEVFNPPKLREKYVELDNDLVALIYFSEPSFYHEEGGRVIYVDCYPDDVVSMFEKVNLDGSLKSLGEILTRVDGFFTGFIVDRSRTVMFRDHVGAIPCNYRVGEEHFTAASFKRMMDYGRGLPPGRIIAWDNFSLKIYRWFGWKRLAGDYVEELKDRLVNAFSRYLPEYFTLGFSGGLDSTVIAYLGSMLGKRFECITVGAEDSVDLQWAEEAATLLGLKLRKIELSEHLVRKAAELVSKFLLSANTTDMSIATVFYLVATNSFHDFIVSGQGADELFGGYYKYFKLGRGRDPKYVQGVMMGDLLKLYETNIERDYLAVMITGKRLIHPFLAKQIYETALSIPVELKITVENNIMRKKILRKVGEKIGIPEKLIMKPKKALQYSSKIQKFTSRKA